MNRGYFLAAVLFFAAAAFARADLEPGLEKPYRLQVVLHIAQNRFLTPIFQDQVQRDLRDQLQLALGPLASVEVSPIHPLLRAVESRGLQSGLDALDKLSDVKTHFVVVDYSAGIYSIQARQYDGLTGLASPVVRRTETSDRALVARAAADLVEKDFGIVGTVIGVDKDDVRLALRGGKLAASLDRWVKPGQVFAITRLTKDNNQVRARRLDEAILEVIEPPHEGVCRCQLWRRFAEQDLSQPPGVLGYRAMKLTTQEGPVRLRLLDDKTDVPLDGVQVHLFKPRDKQKSELTTNRDGLAVSRNSFQNFAIVQVLSGGSVRAQFPVALVDDRPVVRRLRDQAEAETQAPIDFRRDQWLGRLYDNLLLASERAVELNTMLGSKSLTAVRDSARRGLENMESEVSLLASERAEIVRQAADRKIPVARLDLSEGDQRLTDLKARQKELAGFAQRLDKALEESKNEKALGLAKLLERARLLESEAEFDQALALYGKVLEAAGDQPKVREKLEQLKAAWSPKNTRHAEARAFLYQLWPKLEVRDLKANLEKAHEALAICKENGDHLTPLKVVLANVSHVANLKQHLDVLRRQDNEDNRAQAKIIVQVADGLRRFHAEATALVGKK